MKPNTISYQPRMPLALQNTPISGFAVASPLRLPILANKAPLALGDLPQSVLGDIRQLGVGAPVEAEEVEEESGEHEEFESALVGFWS